MKFSITLSLSSIALFLILSSFAIAGDTSTFQADILGPSISVIAIQVPNTISFGNISVGDQTDDVRIDINNTGNTAILVTPRLTSGAHAIYNHTYFRRITSEPYYRIGNYTHSISAPSSGGVRSSYMYAKLDLRNYSGTFAQGSITRIESDVKFFVASA